MTTLPNPRVGIAVMLFNGRDNVLIGKRKGSHGSGTYAFPGGHLEYGESWSSCARRELLEETGIETAPIEKFVTVTNEVFEKDTKHYVTIFIALRVKDQDQKPQLLEPNKCEVWEWVSWKDLLSEARTQLEQGPDASRPLFEPIVSLAKVSEPQELKCSIEAYAKAAFPDD